MKTFAKVRSGIAVCAGILFMASAISAEPRCVARYTFEEADSLIAVDVSDNGHTGTIHDVAKRESAWGKAACFSGNVSSWIEIQDHADFKQTSAFTIEAFLTVTGLPYQHGLIFFRGDGAGAGDPWYICVQPYGAIRFHIESSNFTAVNLEAPIPLNTPLHIVATFSAADRMMKLYINGALAASQTTTVVPMAELPGGAGGGWVTIGNHPYPGGHVFPFTGLIEEVAFYNYTLDSAAVRQHYQAFFRNGSDRLLAHWSFDSSAGVSTLYDVTGHGYDAFASGTGLTLSNGVKGRALNCSGAGYEIVASNTWTAFNLNKFSIECWYNSTVDPATGISYASQLMCYQNIASGVRNGYAVYINTSGNVDFGMATKSGGDYVNTVSRTSLNAGQWYHIVATYDSMNLKLYINGVLESNVMNGSGGYPAPGVDARIGCQRQIGGNVWQFLNGKIDEMKFYSYALSSDSIAAHYHAIDVHPRNDSVPVLVPMVPEIQTNRKPVFRWHHAHGATSYRIVVDIAGDFLDPIVILPLPDTMFRPRVNLPFGKIFWKVSANTNFTRYSAVDTFMVIARTGTERSLSGDLESGAFTVVSSGRGFSFAFSVKDRARVTIQLFSMAGACMATLSDGETVSGYHTVQWNGMDNNSRAVPRGSYLVRCVIGSKIVTKKIALVR